MVGQAWMRAWIGVTWPAEQGLERQEDKVAYLAQVPGAGTPGDSLPSYLAHGG